MSNPQEQSPRAEDVKTIYLIVNGTETSVEFSENDTARKIAETALEQTGNTWRKTN